ncbi:MAG TPA: HAMP domain-containing sensor histidine kinase [Elusimicrobiota bacterium]|nr:HAMP domain-containing sensor histidine kinase [Elusimicrobiota bacterium]
MTKASQRIRSLVARVPSLSLRVTITLFLTSFVALSYLALSGALLRLESGRVLNQARDETETSARSVTKAVANAWDPAKPRLVNKRALDRAGLKSRVLAPHIIYAVFQDPAGHVLYAAKRNSQFQWVVDHTQFPPAVRNMVYTAGSASRVFYSYYPKAAIREFLVAAHGKRGELVGVVRVGLDETRVLRVNSQVAGQNLWNLLGVNLIATLCVSALIFMVATRFETPLAGLYRRAISLRAGQLGGPEAEPEASSAPSKNVLALLTKEFASIETLVGQLRRNQSELASTLSHELRAPLQVIVGCVGVIRQGDAGPISREVDNYLGDIEETAKDFESFIDNVLDLARLEDGRISIAASPVSSKAAVQRAVAMFSKKAREYGIRLLQETGSERDQVMGDESRIVQVLVNLILNAIKFTPSGGTIRVGTTDRLGAVEFYVSDTGPGIPQDKQARLFQEYYQVPELEPLRGSRGLGIGLTLCKRLVERQGGKIWLESDTGKGTAVRFHLESPKNL